MNDTQVREALYRSISTIVTAVKDTVEETPPELVADIIEQGIVIAGGGGLLRGLDEVIANSTRIPTRLAEDPLTSVVRGTGYVLEDLEAVAEVLLPSVHNAQLK